MKPLLTILAAAALASSALAADAVRPNILWLVAEDANVKWFGCYGSTQATTPNIDKLVSEGFRYANAFATAPVCAASRSSWITGVYSLSPGTDGHVGEAARLSAANHHDRSRIG